MRSAVVILAMLALWLLTAPSASAQNAGPNCSLMIDVSQSMEGYSFAPGQPLLNLTDQLRARCGQSYLFGDGEHPRPLRAGETLRFKDTRTLIGQNLHNWAALVPDGSYLVLLTDNVSDDGGSQSDPTKQFYSELRDDNSVFTQIVVMALRERFDGRLYDPKNGHRPSVPYSGPRALTLYLLGKNAASDMEGFKRLRVELQTMLARLHHHDARTGDDDSAYVTFDVKPFAAETFRVESRDASIQSESENAGDEGRCSADARFDPATKTFLLVDQPMDQDCTVKARLKVRFAARWCLVDAGLSASLDMRVDDPDVLKQSVQYMPVSPAVATLCADEKDLLVGLHFSALRFRDNLSFFERLARTFTGSFVAEGTLSVRGSIRRENVYLEKGLAEAWSYGTSRDIYVAMSPDPSIQRKVFRLQEGVRAVIPGQQLDGYELTRYPVKIEVRYDQSPLFVLLLLLLLALAIIGAIVWYMRRPVLLLIEPETGPETHASLGFLASVTAPSDGVTSLKLRNLALLLWASSNGRILKGRILGMRGGRVEIAPSGNARVARRSWMPARRKTGDEDYDGDVSELSQTGAGEPVLFTVRSVRPDRDALSEGDHDGY